MLLFEGLEATMSDLGGGIDELELNLLEGGTRDLGTEGLSEDNDPLSGSQDSSLEHNEVFVDITVVGKSSHGGDGFLSEIELSGGVVVHFTSSLVLDSLAQSVDLLVDLSTGVITFLTSTGYSP